MKLGTGDRNSDIFLRIGQTSALTIVNQTMFVVVINTALKLCTRNNWTKFKKINMRNRSFKWSRKLEISA